MFLLYVLCSVSQYLMSHVPWYGPIYNEAFRLEEKCEHHATALAIVERGLKEIPRYGPLWFGAFRLCERCAHPTINTFPHANSLTLLPPLPPHTIRSPSSSLYEKPAQAGSAG
jgi:hypothetical protein